MQAILTIVITFFSFLAGFSGLIGGIILLFNGDWFLALILVFIAGIAPFGMSFAMMPALIFAIPAAKLSEQKNFIFLGKFFLWLSSLYFGLVFALWSSYILFYVFETSSSFWGAVFASFGTAISPIIYMTSKTPIQDDLDMISNSMANFSAEVSLFAMIVYAIIYGGTFFDFVFIYMIFFAFLSAIMSIAIDLMFIIEN